MNLDNLLDQPAPWLQTDLGDSGIIMSSRIRLARNLEGYPFVSRMSREQAVKVEKLVRKQLTSVLPVQNYGYYILDRLSTTDMYFLMERHLISKEHINGRFRRAVAIGYDEDLSIMINEEDHLRIQMMSSRMDLRELWNKIDTLDDKLSDCLEYCFDDILGYLTACPTNVGTGLRASVMLHLPAINMTGQMDKVCQAAAKVNLAVRGFYGEGTAALGDFFQISNQVTLGKKEQTLVATIEKVVPQVLEQEKKIRASMLKNNREELQETIREAIKTLQTCEKISSEKTMSHLSSIRMGINMGIVDYISISQINRVFLLSQPSHLQKKERKSLSSEERDTIRANFFREFFSKY